MSENVTIFEIFLFNKDIQNRLKHIIFYLMLSNNCTNNLLPLFKGKILDILKTSLYLPLN